jgi:hypothetical protein
VTDDDDILDAYERELDGADLIQPRRASNRGFWLVATTIALGAIVLMVEIFANRPMVNAISRTENDLRAAMRNADRIYAEGGSFTPADADALGAVDADRIYVAADQPADQPGDVSVYASGDTWAASSPTRSGTCFSIKQVAGQDITYLVSDGDCTGMEALQADQSRW